jgi:hypothetical protein
LRRNRCNFSLVLEVSSLWLLFIKSFYLLSALLLAIYFKTISEDLEVTVAVQREGTS